MSHLIMLLIVPELLLVLFHLNRNSLKHSPPRPLHNVNITFAIHHTFKGIPIEVAHAQLVLDIGNEHIKGMPADRLPNSVQLAEPMFSLHLIPLLDPFNTHMHISS